MNIVGPLANPASAGRQVVGVADAARVPLIAGALAQLGSVHALVVHGEPGMDEISPLGTTQVVEIRRGPDGASTVVAEWRIEPRAFGLPRCTADDLAGGEPAENAAIIEAVLGGGGPPGARAAVVLNAAAALYVSGDRAAVRRRAGSSARSARRRGGAGDPRAPATRLRRTEARMHEGGGRQASSPFVPSAGARSVAAHHADDDALDADVVLVDVDRRHRLVRRLQADAAVALAIELLHRRRRCRASSR